VGATVLNGRTLEPIEPIQSLIEKKWPGKLLFRKKLRKVKGLTFQEVPQQRRCSFLYEDETALDEVYKLAGEYDCDVLLSAGKYLDILPGGVNKGATLKQLVHMMDFQENMVLGVRVNQDDLSLYGTSYKCVAVGDVVKALVEATAGKKQVYQAIRAGAGGILEVFQHFPEFKPFYRKPEN